MNYRSVLALLVISLAGCEDRGAIVGSSLAYPSPDGTYTVTLEEVDNGLGFGQGAIYDEVHVTRQGEPIGDHSISGHSVVFYAESAYKVGSQVKVTWMDKRHLRVEYDRDQHPGREVRQLDGVSIEFLPMDSK